MSIDWMHFTPWRALTGGLLIGLAAALLILLNGRVAGISGILGSLLAPRRKGWQAMFILGLVIAPLIYRLVSPLPEMRFTHSWPWLAVAGILVGFGTRLGSGCTSGHGVCGLARLSPRSLAATAVFMLFGIITVFVIRHLLAGVAL
ncbi:YeeE/YedE family protein [Acerihabitans arboris]|uniref:YeeE/YedE family protein n=1 Tax=Acerihabitans arboris TaxID=2691583 RepID=A0A845SJ44_9GAMM|nr:YeeE/YedE family protein [Acerihabitans arboris]NDL64940.1 YeeE/YedE family protein [Acerihabitans arboris]